MTTSPKKSTSVTMEGQEILIGARQYVLKFLVNQDSNSEKRKSSSLASVDGSKESEVESDDDSSGTYSDGSRYSW